MYSTLFFFLYSDKEAKQNLSSSRVRVIRFYLPMGTGYPYPLAYLEANMKKRPRSLSLLCTKEQDARCYLDRKKRTQRRPFKKKVDRLYFGKQRVRKLL